MPSKKTNTVLFMLAGTVVNLALLLFFIIFGFVFVSVLASKVPALENAAGILTVVVLIAALALSFLIYSKLVKWATRKFSLEENLSPLFSSRKPKRREEDQD